MKYHVLIAPAATGIILNTDANSYHSGPELPYLHFDSLDDVTSFASRTVSIFGQLEFIVYDEFNEYLKMIYPEKL